MNVSSDFYNQALLYLSICGGCLFLQSIILTLSSFLRSNTFVFQGFLVSAGINILNVGLNALFLYVFNLPGIFGVAIATIISRIIGCIVLLIMIIKLPKIKLSLKDGICSTKKELRKLLKVSIPSAGEFFSYSLSQIVILAIINIIGLRLNSASPTAKTYVNIMVQFTFIFTNSISQAMQIMLGRYLGAKNYAAAEKIITRTLFLSLITSIIIAIVQAVFAEFIFSFFTTDNNVIELCKKIMWLEVALEIGRAINIVLVRALQTSGDVIFPTALAIIFCWSVAVSGSYILGVTFKLGVIGIWIAMSIDELCRAFIFIIRFKKGN